MFFLSFTRPSTYQQIFAHEKGSVYSLVLRCDSEIPFPFPIDFLGVSAINHRAFARKT